MKNCTLPAGANIELNQDVREARAAVFLVETSDRKRPHDYELGGSKQVRACSVIVFTHTCS